MDIEHELNRVADGYRAQGYSATIRPEPDQLPMFAKDFKLEIVGRRGTEGVLVAVKKNRDEVAADSNMQRYAEITGTQPGWRFDFVILEAENPKAREARGAREFSSEDITHSLDQAENLSRMGFTRFAVIAAWAALEAAMRMRLRASGQEAGWGSMPRQMLRELYSAGAFTPDEFHRVELASQLRNQIVHGFSSQVAENESSEVATVQILKDVTRRLVSESQPVKQPA
jgi:HEPN domain-containing protein